MADFPRPRLFRARRQTPYVSGNRVELLIDGAAFFECLIETIAGAKRYALVESYIFANDAIGKRVADALIERAEAGVEVAVHYDGFGSLGLGRELPGRLAAGGVKIHEFRPMRLFARWPLNKRNHRKSLVVDGRVGLVGGMNISDDYAAPEDGGRGWHDAAVKIEGPAVLQLESIFRDLWSKHAKIRLETPPGFAAQYPDGHEVRFIENKGRKDRAAIRRAYLRAIVGAQRTVRITTAYFSPDRLLLRALCKAARRGVAVEIITAGATDMKPVLQIARGLYGRLFRAGVKIYEWHERVLHSKTAVVDGQWTTIGSANLNHRTWLLDLEVNATILSPEIGAQMDGLFVVDRARSRPIDRALWRSRPVTQRMLEWFFGLFRRMV